MPSRRSFLAMAAVIPAAFALPGPAVASSLDQYRAQGVIAERYDGFVEIRVENPPAEAAQIVRRINAERRQVYEKRAAQQGVDTDAVGRVYAKQILENAPAGTYFKQPSGSYIRK